MVGDVDLVCRISDIGGSAKSEIDPFGIPGFYGTSEIDPCNFQQEARASRRCVYFMQVCHALDSGGFGGDEASSPRLAAGERKICSQIK